MKRSAIYICLFALLSPLNAVFPQSKYSQAQKRLAEGNKLLIAGNYKDAKKAFKRALKSDKNLLAAYSGLGKIAMAREDWGEMNGQFDKILDRDPNNIEAHYYRGVANREIGKFRPKFANAIPLVNKLLEFQKSEEHFKRVLAQDSLFSDALYQYGLLQCYRDKYKEAIWLGQRQIALKPELVAAQVGLFRMYRYYIVSTGEDAAIAWLGDQPWHHARFFIGEKYRREKKFEQADSVYHELLLELGAMSAQPVYLALAKSTYMQEKPVLAESYYWKAVRQITNQIDANLIFEQLKYIVTDAELKAFQVARTMKEKTAFFRAFWAKRDPLPASEFNVRIAEHYRRLVFSEDNYEFSGFRTWVNSADKLKYLKFPASYKLNKEFNDKGLVYLRHGPPDDKVATVNPNVPSNESWKYWQSGRNREMTFHFLYDENASGNLWTLTPTIRNAEMLADRATWALAYQQMLSSSNPADLFKYEDEIIYESKQSVDVGFNTDRHTWKNKIEPLDVPVSMATFRGPSGKTKFEVYYGVPVLDIAKKLSDETTRFVVEKGMAIHDLDWKLLGKVTREMTVPFDRPNLQKGRLYIDAFQTELDPKQYKLGFHVRPKNTELLGGFSNIQIAIPDYSSPTLSVSDIELAARVEPMQGKGLFVKHGLLVLPNPSRSYSRDQLVHIYFEIYNLAKDADGRTSFTVEYIVSRLDKKRKNPFDRKKRDRSSVSFLANRQGDSEFSAEFLAIDVKKLKKGDVVLSIRITDKHSKQSVVKENQFALF